MKRKYKFRIWNGTEMIDGVVPWQWDFALTTMLHKCIESNGTGLLGSGGTEAKFEVPGYAFVDSVMQFTGLKDKNGIEIFEGDILKVADDYQAVFFNEATFGFDLMHAGGDSDPLYNIIEVFDGDTELAGNIYQNKDLFDWEAAIKPNIS